MGGREQASPGHAPASAGGPLSVYPTALPLPLPWAAAARADASTSSVRPSLRPTYHGGPHHHSLIDVVAECTWQAAPVHVMQHVRCWHNRKHLQMGSTAYDEFPIRLLLLCCQRQPRSQGGRCRPYRRFCAPRAYHEWKCGHGWGKLSRSTQSSSAPATSGGPAASGPSVARRPSKDQVLAVHMKAALRSSI